MAKNIRSKRGKPFRTHGLKHTPAYSSWVHMLHRCQPHSKNAKYYYERGIGVCERWLSFEAFLEDMGPRPSDSSLDRINNDGNYEPSNCRWASKLQQQGNTRHTRRLTLGEETYGVREWGRRTGLGYATILSRLRYGWTIERALTTPPLIKRKRRGQA